MLIFRIKKHQGFGGHSYCDKTGKRLIWKDLIPIISYVIYHGRCRECGDRLPLKYPIIEFCNALLFSVIFLIASSTMLGILEVIGIYLLVEALFIGVLYLLDK